MTKLSHARVALSPALSALLALSGCATKTMDAPMAPAQPPKAAAETKVTTLAPTASDEIPSARRPVKARERALMATTQLEPCIFSGSLRTVALLYAQAAGGQAIAQLDERGAVQIDRLELPSTPDGRARVVVGYPIHMEAYIDENEHVVQIDERVDVVPGHVWLDPGRVVHASFLFGDTARISLRFLDGTMPPSLVTWFSCADLSFRQGTYFNGPTPMGDTVDLRAERISIHESAGGREIAAIQGPTLDRTVWLVEKKPGWLHVEGYGEFHFRGWIRAKGAFFPPPEWGFIGLLSGPDVTHQVTRPIPLRIEATDAAPVIANAATGAEIFIAPGPPGYRVIQIGGGVDAPDGTSFFAREADLMGAVQLAEGVEPGEPESADPPKENASVPSAPMPLLHLSFRYRLRRTGILPRCPFTRRSKKERGAFKRAIGLVQLNSCRLP
ncbi:MAG: hypothetical protein IPM54_12400 [Polyangiaceae bacterium]|nr:hypothetical protein [Polyangiaceae bacterium]